MTKYERLTFVSTKEQAKMIKENLKARGIKSYYKFTWIVMIEVRE